MERSPLRRSRAQLPFSSLDRVDLRGDLLVLDAGRRSRAALKGDLHIRDLAPGRCFVLLAINPKEELLENFYYLS